MKNTYKFNYVLYRTCVELLDVETGEIITEIIPARTNKSAYEAAARKINSDEIMSSKYVLTGQVYRREPIETGSFAEALRDIKKFADKLISGLGAFGKAFDNHAENKDG